MKRISFEAIKFVFVNLHIRTSIDFFGDPNNKMRFSANDPEGLDKMGEDCLYIEDKSPTTSKVELHPLTFVKDDIFRFLPKLMNVWR